MKCQHCVKDCEWCINDECWYEPNDYYGDIGSATVKEMKEQNESNIRVRKNLL